MRAGTAWFRWLFAGYPLSPYSPVRDFVETLTAIPAKLVKAFLSLNIQLSNKIMT